LSLSATPKLGQVVTLALSGALPFTSGGFVYSEIPASSTPVAPGCEVYVDIAAFNEFAAIFTTPFGSHALTYPLPTNTLLSGVMLRVQAYLLTPGVGSGFGLSNGLELTLGY
jgi:hypothetical protein